MANRLMGKIWLPDRKLLSPTHFTCNSHINSNFVSIATLHAREVTKEELK